MNLILDNGIAVHKHVETTIIYTRVLNRSGKAISSPRLESFWQDRFYAEPDKTSERWFKPPPSAMNKQIGGMESLFMHKGNEGANIAS
jgi:hypothetical protein